MLSLIFQNKFVCTYPTICLPRTVEMGSNEDICFVEGTIHQESKIKYPNFTDRLIRLNNYDHVTADVFNKLKILLNDASLSRLKKPTPKICIACCSYLNNLVQTQIIELNTKKHKSLPSMNELSALSPEDVLFNSLVNKIKTRSFTEDQLKTLMHVVGERLMPVVNQHVAELNKKNAGDRLGNMATMTNESYWDDAFGPLKHFVLGMIHGNR